MRKELDPFHLQRSNKLSKASTSQYTVKMTRKEHLLTWNSETTQNLNIYLYNYQTETATFLTTKHEKTTYGMQLFKFL